MASLLGSELRLASPPPQTQSNFVFEGFDEHVFCDELEELLL
jgi:hypothetical protein